MKKILPGILIFLSVAIRLFSDDATGTYNPKLGVFSILDNSNIEMTKEVVDIYNDKVKVVFTFTNLTNSKQSVCIGFPIVHYPSVYVGLSGNELNGNPILSEDDIKKIEQYYNFKSFCNGNELKRIVSKSDEKSKMDDKHPTYYFITELHFEPNESLELTNTYNQKPDTMLFSNESYTYTIKYILVTGKTWAGPIKDCLVRYHDAQIIKNTSLFTFNFLTGQKLRKRVSYSPEPTRKYYDYKTKENIVEWYFTNLEPSEDIEISLDYANKIIKGLHEISWLLKTNNMISERVLSSYIRYSIWYQPEDRYIQELKEISKDEFEFYIHTIYNETFFTKGNVPVNHNNELSKTYARFLLNALYALHGYQFTTPEWNKVFTFFNWYNKLSSFDDNFSAKEKAMINILQKAGK